MIDNCTKYVDMDGWRVFDVYVDGEHIKRFSLVSLNDYFICKGYKKIKNIYGTREYWDEFRSLYIQYPLQKRPELTCDEFCEVLGEYRNQEIRISLDSDNPIVRMFAILDRRVGKRTP